MTPEINHYGEHHYHHYHYDRHHAGGAHKIQLRPLCLIPRTNFLRVCLCLLAPWSPDKRTVESTTFQYQMCVPRGHGTMVNMTEQSFPGPRDPTEIIGRHIRRQWAIEQAPK
jgi:hypothetical protein